MLNFCCMYKQICDGRFCYGFVDSFIQWYSLTFTFNNLSDLALMQKALSNNQQTIGGEYLVSHHTSNILMWIQILSWTDWWVPCTPLLEIFSPRLKPTLICELCNFPFPFLYLILKKMVNLLLDLVQWC